MTLLATRSHLPLAVILAIVLAMASGSLAQRDVRSFEFCGSDPTYWVCGEIIVKPLAGANISEILGRHGGSPADIIDQTDLGGYGVWYLISVPVGQEEEAVRAYLADPEVEHAELNRVIFLDPDPTCLTCELELELAKYFSSQHNMTLALQAQIRSLEVLVSVGMALSLAAITLSVAGYVLSFRQTHKGVVGRPPRIV